MGWIAALKQGAPSSTQIERMTATGNADMTKPITVVTGTTTVTLTKPVDATPGQRKTIICKAGTTTVSALASLKGDRVSTADVFTLIDGGVAEFIWTGTEWYGVPFDGDAADVNVSASE